MDGGKHLCSVLFSCAIPAGFLPGGLFSYAALCMGKLGIIMPVPSQKKAPNNIKKAINKIL
jgi:hypothetical protein